MFSNSVLEVKRRLNQVHKLDDKFSDDLLSAANFLCSSDTTLEECVLKLKKCKAAADNVIRIFVIHAVQLMRTEQVEAQFDGLIQIVNLGLNDFTSDTRGDVGALVRHKTFNCLKTHLEPLIGSTRLTEAQKERLLSLYKIAVCQFSCSRVEQMKLLGIKSLFKHSKLLGLAVQQESYTHISQPQELIFDMAEQTNEELQKSLEKADAALLENSFQLFTKIFMPDPLLKFVCLKQLVLNTCYGQKEEIAQTILLIKSLPQATFYTFILKLMDKVTNAGYQAQLQFGCILISNHLFQSNYIPDLQQISTLVDKTVQYCNQDQINFSVF